MRVEKENSIQSQTPIEYPKEIGRDATLAVIALFGGYTLLQTLYLTAFNTLPERDLVDTILAPLFGIFAIVMLFATGFTRHDCFLAYAPISKKGALVLIATGFLMFAIIPAGRWVEWDWFKGLVTSPGSGIAQELYFRAALLPLLLRIFHQRPMRAVIIHSIFFGIWHMGVIWLAPIGPAIMVMAVPAICGIAWGWQVHHDRTILHVTLLHTALLVIMSMFTF